MEEMNKRLEAIREMLANRPGFKYTLEDYKLDELKTLRAQMIYEKSQETGVPFEYLNQAETPADLPGLVAKYYQEKQDGRGKN